jgi:uncharacterized OB-fold protein
MSGIGEIEARPDRTLGPGHDDFWAFCAGGELRLQGCTDCGHINWPVTSACNICGSARLDWRAMSGRGTVASWCEFARDYYGGAFPLPWPVIIVALEEGPFFLANPQGFAVGAEAIGTPVKVAFLRCCDSAGEFALPVFEPEEPRAASGGTSPAT